MPRNRRNKGARQQSMSSSQRQARDYRISVRGELKKVPDTDKIARVVVAMAIAKAEAEARAEEAARRAKKIRTSRSEPEARR